MMPWRDMHRAAISCQPTCRARAPVASMGSVIRTRSSASRLAGSLFRYSRACAQQHGRPSAAGRPGAHLAFTSQPDRNPGMSCPTHLVGHPQGLCVAMWAQHAPHYVFTTTVGGFEYFEAAARRCGLTACSVQRPGLQAAPAWGNPYAAQLHKTPGARAARRTPRQAAGRAARLEGDLIAHVADMVRLGRGQHRHCLLQQHQARAQDRHHLPPCSAAVGSSAASKARFLDRTCHARSAADRWVKGEHAGPVRCSCNATAPAARLARFPPACDTQSRAGMRPGCAQAPGARSKHRAPAGFELTAARLDRLCRVDERAIGHAARRLHLARAESQAGARTRWQPGPLPCDHTPQPVLACAPLRPGCQVAHHRHVDLAVQRLRTWPSMVGSQSCAAS